jgi:uncharacterized membrane protein (UPF0127 family)
MPGQAIVTIRDKQWSAFVANTTAELTSGLSGVESIPAQTGMLFDLGYDWQTIQIDMTRMLFPLDIVFINSTQGVVGVMHNVQLGEADVRFENVNVPGARWFLEINAGEAEGISVGDNVAIQGNIAPAQLNLTSLLNYAVIMMMVIFVGRMAIRAVSPPKPELELYGPRGERLLQTVSHKGLAAEILRALKGKGEAYRAFVKYPPDRSAFVVIGSIIGGHYSWNPAGFTVWVDAWERNPEWPADHILGIRELKRPRTFEATQEGVKRALKYVEEEFPTFTESAWVSRSIPVYVAHELGILKLEHLPQTEAIKIIDARGMTPSEVYDIHRQYPPNLFRGIGVQYSHLTTQQDIEEFKKRAVEAGAVVLIVQEYGLTAYVPIAYLPQVIEGGEPVPSRYRELVGFIDEPLPEYSLATLDLMPAVKPEVGERKIDAVLRQLKNGVESIQESARFREFLVTMSRFHDYSIGNQILIAIQKPDATKVAGFNTWKELGRWVKKGEKGISILAPVLPPRPACPVCGAKIPRGAKYCPQCGEPVEGEEAIEVTPAYFKVVYVFDISQTEGKPLPEFEVPVLTGEVDEELFGRLLALMKKRGVEVSFESRPDLPADIKGQYLAPNRIWVRPEEPRAQQLKTLLHEIAHYYSEGVFHIPRRDAETIAESAAFVVGAHHGFDTGVRSFPYVALWSQDRKVLEENLEAIRRVSTAIMTALEGVSEAVVLSPQVKHTVSMPTIPEEAKQDPLFVDYIQTMVTLGERVTGEEARIMWEAWQKRWKPSYLPQTTSRTQLRFADSPLTVTADTLRGWLRRGTARPIQTAGFYGAEGYKPRLYVVGETIYQIEWGPAKKHYLLPASEEHMAHETKERLREEGVEIGPPEKPPPGKPTRDDVTVGARQKLGVWITDKRTGVTLAEWTDRDARGLFEEGLLRGRIPVSAWEAPDSDLVKSVLDYAESIGLLAKESPVAHLPQTEKGQYAWLITDPETGEIIIKPGYATVSKAKRAARDFAIRRAKYAGEHSVKLRIYDREPDIGNLEAGVVFEGRILIPEGIIVEAPAGSENITDEEWKFAEGLWQTTREDFMKRDPAGTYLWALITRYYPEDRDKQIRAMGFMNEVLSRYPGGSIPKDEAVKVARKWDVLKMVVREMIEFLPKVKGALVKKQPAVVPTELRRPHPRKEELEFLPDSPEVLAQTIDAIGYREKIDTAFQEAIRRAKGLSDIYRGFKEFQQW